MVHRSGAMHDDHLPAPDGRNAADLATPPGPTPPLPAANLTGFAPPPPPAPRRRRLLGVAAVVVAVLIVFSAGVAVGQAGPGSQAAERPSYSPSATAPDWRLLDEAYELLDQHFVDPAALDPLDLERGAIVGMTESLDDRGHTGYLTPEEVKARDESLSGTFVGVGAVLDQQDGTVRIVRVLRDSPAERAGLKAGEEIVKVDGASVDGLTLDEVVSRVRGIEGTDVTLELRSPGGANRSLTITRAKLDLPVASWAFVPGTKDAVLRLESFSAGAAKAATAAIREALDQGAEGIVLDLRGNPGGYVNEPVEVASQLLADGVVYVSVDRSGTRTSHEVKPGGIATEIPLVVLVDDQTASSAEILTGALQDAGRGRVVGVTTYGTGTVVNTYPLQDGGALTIGTERWLTPKGRAIWREGLVPDEVVELPPGAALVVPDDLPGLGAGGLAGTADAQLKAAVAALDRARAGAGDAGGAAPGAGAMARAA
jgi:carboxyl-terminal processing protease